MEEFSSGLRRENSMGQEAEAANDQLGGRRKVSSRLGRVGVHPCVSAKSAEAVEKEGDELPRTAPLEAGSRGKKE
jgi:hypothetical protein